MEKRKGEQNKSTNDGPNGAFIKELVPSIRMCSSLIIISIHVPHVDTCFIYPKGFKI